MLQLLIFTLLGLSLSDLFRDFTVRDWAGEGHLLMELQRHETVVVNFWATWCPPCREELPLLLAYHEKGQIQLIAINVGDTYGTVARFLSREGLELLPVYFASHRELFRLNIPGLPVTYVIRSGELSNVYYGPLRPTDLAVLLGEE